MTKAPQNGQEGDRLEGRSPRCGEGVRAEMRSALRRYFGGPCRTRTCDQVIMSHTDWSCKDLCINDLQAGENPVTPTVTPAIPKDPKQTLLNALRAMPRDVLLEALAEALGGS